MSRSGRRWVAWIGMLGIVFAQMIAAAHACRLGDVFARDSRTSVISHGASTAAPTDVHCAAHATNQPAPPANLCEVHCADGVTSVAAMDLPAFAPVALPAPELPLPDHARRVAWLARAAVETQGGAPPRNLQFCRLLI